MRGFNRAILRRNTLMLCILICCCYTGRSSAVAQDIILRNSSLEGILKQSAAPPSWYICSNSPDIQPGWGGVTLPASEGNTYIGLLSSESWAEGISQELNTELKAGRTYSLAFDLAYQAIYYNQKVCDGALALYGGNSVNDNNELLWKSELFYHVDWKRYVVVFSPNKNCKYLIIKSYFSAACNKGNLSGVLIDNLSPTIREIPQIMLTTQNTCKGTNTGKATVKVAGTVYPCTYSWMPGGQTTNEIDKLAGGTYEITVKAANGATAVAKVNVEVEELQSKIAVVMSECNGDNKNKITVNTSGGTLPYRYYLNGNGYGSYSPEFENLASGNYSMLVQDEHGCIDYLKNIKLTEPQPLEIQKVLVSPVSCNETKDGKIALDVRGGTAPYSYSLDLHSWQGDSSWNQLDAGRYSFHIKDNNECKITGEAEVTKNWHDCAVLVPTAFSPNGDGLNDIFRAKVHDAVRNFKLIVYNRWGQQVFLSNDPAQGWEGGQQTTGTFLWVLMYTDSKNQDRKQQGNLVLIK